MQHILFVNVCQCYFCLALETIISLAHDPTDNAASGKCAAFLRLGPNVRYARVEPADSTIAQRLGWNLAGVYVAFKAAFLERIYIYIIFLYPS